LTLPLREKDLLIKIRTGGYTEEEVLALGVVDLEKECQDLLRESDLPEERDKQLLSKVIERAYRDHWGKNA
jgi:hypothetical protein